MANPRFDTSLSGFDKAAGPDQGAISAGGSCSVVAALKA
jgi:hypothetical protein